MQNKKSDSQYIIDGFLLAVGTLIAALVGAVAYGQVVVNNIFGWF